MSTQCVRVIQAVASVLLTLAVGLSSSACSGVPETASEKSSESASAAAADGKNAASAADSSKSASPDAKNGQNAGSAGDGSAAKMKVVPGGDALAGRGEQTQGIAGVTQAGARFYLGVLIGAEYPGQGVEVSGVIAGSPAEAIGIRAGMGILEVNGVLTDSVARLVQTVNASNGTVAITVGTATGIVDLIVELPLTGAGPGKVTNRQSRYVLGVVFDPTYQGQGLRVADVLVDGPADYADVTPGSIILGVNGVQTETTDTLVSVIDAANGRVVLTISSIYGEIYDAALQLPPRT